MAPTRTHPELSPRLKRWFIIAHDLLATALALGGAVILRYQFWQIGTQSTVIIAITPVFVLTAALVYRAFNLYASKWRFASLPDLVNIFKASSVLAFLLLVAGYVLWARELSPWLMFGEKTIIIYWLLQVLLLGGPRLAHRYLKYLQSGRVGTAGKQAVLVMGRGTEAEVVVRALETGLGRRFTALGILSPRRSDLSTTIRNVPVLGGFAELERIILESKDSEAPVTHIILAPNEFAQESESEMLLATASRLEITLLRMQTAEEGPFVNAALKPVNIEDLLFRPSVEIDRAVLTAFLSGKRVIVTGGGGSIGSEICARLITFGIVDLLILDNSEPALYNVLEALAPARTGSTRISGKIANVRDRDRIFETFREFRPDLVFHAAALKQVPFLESDWTEAIKTNVFGTINVADAAALTASAAVLISTDKAVEPVSILGATKRFGEIYAALIDAEAGAACRPLRLLSVRFGNVLGSVGSVVPRFKAQIERGGPVTVTHPDMVRYFMTIREACDLVLTAAAHAVDTPTAMSKRASVYVLKMGQPARILDLAKRMIRLAGYEPDSDIEIKFTGVRPGERLNEYLFAADEPAVGIGVDGVTAALSPGFDRVCVTRWLKLLAGAVESGNLAAAHRVFAETTPAFPGPAIHRLGGTLTEFRASSRLR